jgi:HSP20 family protein
MLFDRVNTLFDPFADRSAAGNAWARASVPAADLIVDKEQVTVVMDVPGLKAEDLEIELIDDVLTVRGERAWPYASKQAGWFRFERGYGKFQRILQVPKGLDPEKINATIADGVLTLQIPQPEALKPRKIAISGGDTRTLLESETNGYHDVTRTPAFEGEATEERELAGATV